jgi:uncharacterized protein
MDDGLAGRLSDAGVARVPTPVAWARLYPPQSRMAPADPPTLQQAIAGSAIHARYAQPVDPDSAYERLTTRLEQAPGRGPDPPPPPPPRDPEAGRSRRTPIQRSIFGVLRSGGRGNRAR